MLKLDPPQETFSASPGLGRRAFSLPWPLSWGGDILLPEAGVEMGPEFCLCGEPPSWVAGTLPQHQGSPMASSPQRQCRREAALHLGHPECQGLDSAAVLPSPTQQPGACLHLPGLRGAAPTDLSTREKEESGLRDLLLPALLLVSRLSVSFHLSTEKGVTTPGRPS